MSHFLSGIVVGKDGLRGHLEKEALAYDLNGSQVLLHLDGGQKVKIEGSLLVPQEDGSYRFPYSLSDLGLKDAAQGLSNEEAVTISVIAAPPAPDTAQTEPSRSKRKKLVTLPRFSDTTGT